MRSLFLNISYGNSDTKTISKARIKVNLGIIVIWFLCANPQDSFFDHEAISSKAS